MKEESVVAYIKNDNIEKPLICYHDKMLEARNAAEKVIERIDTLVSQLEKDSGKRNYYLQKKDECMHYLNDTEKFTKPCD